jgi:tRNA threonylcarbamoyladenosine dehydratase
MSNTNRQIHTLTTTMGQSKIHVMKERINQINPQCQVTMIFDFISFHNIDTIIRTILKQTKQLSGVIDAIDNCYEKVAIIHTCVEYHIPIVSVGGSAGFYNPNQIISHHDIVNVMGDKLLKATRKILRNTYHYPMGQSYQDRKKCDRTKKWNIYCIYSTEESPTSMKNDESDESSLFSNQGLTVSSSFRTCDSGMGTACFVTGTMGFMASQIMIEGIAMNHLLIPRKPKGKTTKPT